MKQLSIMMTTLALALSATASAQITPSEVHFTREGDQLVVEMTLNAQELKVASNRALLLTPQVSDGQKSVDLTAIGIYGRRRYYYYLRNYSGMLSGNDNEQSYRVKELRQRVSYRDAIPYEAWMNGAHLSLNQRRYGCCNVATEEHDSRLATYRDPAAYQPPLVYAHPTAVGVKRAQLEGSAQIQFPAGQCVVLPDYGNNRTELAKIAAVIDSVKNDADISISSIRLKGFASPEGDYQSNARLAAARTEAISKYLCEQEQLDHSLLGSESEPEDWEGVKRYLIGSNLAESEAVLHVIDSEDDPDRRERRIRREYPAAYQVLTQDCYPSLRHTDYRVSYTISQFSDVEALRRTFAQNPRKLSLNELYLLAQSYEPGSEEYNSVFMTAVRLYPTDEAANLNAANVLLSKRRTDDAERYLKQAGDSPEAQYARGISAMMRTNYRAAIGYLHKAQAGGIKEADEVLRQVALFSDEKETQEPSRPAFFSRRR